jgi:hypothetical protein
LRIEEPSIVWIIFGGKAELERRRKKQVQAKLKPHPFGGLAVTLIETLARRIPSPLARRITSYLFFPDQRKHCLSDRKAGCGVVLVTIGWNLPTDRHATVILNQVASRCSALKCSTSLNRKGNALIAAGFATSPTVNKCRCSLQVLLFQFQIHAIILLLFMCYKL